MSVEAETTRTRTITWDDPMPVETGRTKSGLELLRAIQNGEAPVPPMITLMGFDLLEIEEGRAVFAVEPAEYHYNTLGVAHGGLACTLLDSAMGCAIQSTLPPGAFSMTLEIKVNLLRPLIRETGLVRCEGTVIHLGGRIATAEGRVVDAAGKLYAHATTTCMIFRDGTSEAG